MIKLSEGNKEKLLKIIVILGIILSVFGVLSKIFEITIFDFLVKLFFFSDIFITPWILYQKGMLRSRKTKQNIANHLSTNA